MSNRYTIAVTIHKTPNIFLLSIHDHKNKLQNQDFYQTTIDILILMIDQWTTWQPSKLNKYICC